jgi:hypothetical protein
MSKNVGYFYWGFLGDKKFNIKLKENSYQIKIGVFN